MNGKLLVKSLVIASVLTMTASVIAATDASEQAIAERIKPVGSVSIGEAMTVATNTKTSATMAPRTGEEIYNKTCTNCHTQGVGTAPKHDDKVAWAPRVAKGRDALMHSLQNGVPGTAMVAKGLCMDCTDAELNNVLDYMLKNVQ